MKAPTELLQWSGGEAMSLRMTKTVGHYVDSDTFGGCEQVMLTLLGHHTRQNWRPVLFHHDEPALSPLIKGAAELGITCRSVPRVTRAYSIGALLALARLLRAERLSVFHAHLNWPLGCRHLVFAAKLARVPIVVATLHLYSSLNGVRFRWMKQNLQTASIDRYIAVSNEVGKRLLTELDVDPTKIRVVPNGIEVDPFKRTIDPAFRSELSGASNRPLVLTPARLHNQKGHEYLLEAAKQVPNALFLFAGDGPERRRLECKAANLGLQDRVRFLGHRHDIGRLLANCDLFVLPSLYEGLPISILEAMAAGKPIIATAVGGTDEVIVDGICGKLVAPRDARSLALAINGLLSDPAAAMRLAAAGRTRVAKDFSAEAMVGGVENLYCDLLPSVSSAIKRC